MAALVDRGCIRSSRLYASSHEWLLVEAPRARLVSWGKRENQRAVVVVTGSLAMVLLGHSGFLAKCWPLDTVVVDGRTKACPVGHRTVASIQNDNRNVMVIDGLGDGTTPPKHANTNYAL